MKLWRIGLLALLVTACGQKEQGLSGTKAAPHDTARQHQLTGDVVEFHIAAGTGDNGWNTEDQMVMVKVGDTLRIYNDDTVQHRLHTNGRPCPHGPDIAPGTSFDCIISKTYDPATDGPLYDHYVGPTARFWLTATAANNFAGDILYDATLNVPIPDVQTIEHHFTVDLAGFIEAPSVHIKISHTYVGDLVITLISPSGKSALLRQNEGGSADTIDQIYGFGGEPNDQLAAMEGESITGEWILRVADTASQDSGMLTYLQLSGSRVFL